MQITIDVPLQRISDLLCSALEGGSNYWYEIREQIEPPKVTFRAMKGHSFPHLDFPLSEGGALMISDLEKPRRKPIRLDLAAMQKGLKIMAEKNGRHFGDFLAENDDATTADVFLQLCVFGDVVYG